MIEEKQKMQIEIQCRKLEKTILSDKELTVTVNNPKETDKGVFANSFILYDVTTAPMNWSVKRRYSDFDWLRKTLVKTFLGFNVPPLPSKKMGNRRFDTDFIIKRMKYLQMFINSVCVNESFKCSEALIAFLQYEDRNKFESKMKEFNSFQPSTYIEELKTLDGKAVISHDDRNEKYFVNISKYFRLQTQLLNKLNYNIKQFYNNINSAAESLSDVQRNFEILNILNSKVLMKPVITHTYEELGYFFKNWKKILIKQNELVKSRVKEFFKFINLEGQAYSTLINNREELNLKYNSEYSKLVAKKEKIFATGDITKFELNPEDRNIDKSRILRDKAYAFDHMCAKESQSVRLIYNQLGYVNKMNIKELKKMIKIYTDRFLDNFKEFDSKFYVCINDVYFFI